MRTARGQSIQGKAVRYQKKLFWVSRVLLVTLTLMLLSTRPVMAVPIIPHQFFGAVYLGNQTAPDGIAISVKINNVTYATTSTIDGKYGYSPIFYVPGDDSDTAQKEGGIDGNIIAFNVDAYQATSYIFNSGMSTRLDIYVPATNVLKLALTVSAVSGQSANYTASGIVTNLEDATVAVATISITWGDGTSSQLVSQNDGTFSTAHTYTTSNTYTVTGYAAKSSYVRSTTASRSVTVTIGAPIFIPTGVGVGAVTLTAETVGTMTSEQAAAALGALTSSQAAAIIAEVATDKAGSIMGTMAADKAGSILGTMTNDKAGSILGTMTNDKAGSILGTMTNDKAASILGTMTNDKAASIIGTVATDKAGSILEKVEMKKAAAIMENLATDKLTGVISVMSEASLTERLPGLSPDKLYSVKPEVLFRSLPHAPTEQLIGEEPPQPPAEATPPVVVLTTPSGARYLAVKTWAEEWVVVMGTPVPVDKLLIKTKQALQNVETTMEVYEKQPPEVAASLPAGQIARAYLNISFKNATPEDIELGHITFKLEKAWIEQNSIHKWSVVLNWYDPELKQWNSLPTKRVEEDDTYVYYTAVISHFSIFAISGSKVLPPADFGVANLTINPAKAEAGEAITISADVTNLSGSAGRYTVTLWINGTVEAGRNISLNAGETKPMSFMVTQDAEGDYEVRVDRLFGSFSVTKIVKPTPPAPAPPVSPPVPPKPINWWLIGGIIAGCVIIGMVIWLIVRRQRVP